MKRIKNKKNKRNSSIPKITEILDYKLKYGEYYQLEQYQKDDMQFKLFNQQIKDNKVQLILSIQYQQGDQYILTFSEKIETFKLKNNKFIKSDDEKFEKKVVFNLLKEFSIKKQESFYCIILINFYVHELENCLEQFKMDGRIVKRIEEKSYLSEYLESCITRNNKQSLFICGLPGTGKTSTLNEILHIKKVVYCFINCVELDNPKEIFCVILKKLFRINSKKNSAFETLINNLENNFENNYLTSESSQSTIIIIVDEADMLYTKKTEVFQNLVDLPYRLNNNCISLILISNRMDLVDTLPSKVKSRIGNSKLLFTAYTREELYEILKERMQGSIFFNETPLKLCSARVASVSGDARRILQISNNCLSTYVNTIRSNFYDKFNFNIDEFNNYQSISDFKNIIDFIIAQKEIIGSDDIRSAINEMQNKTNYNLQLSKMDDFSILVLESMVELKAQYSTEIIEYDLLMERCQMKLEDSNIQHKNLKNKDQLHKFKQQLENFEDFMFSFRRKLNSLANAEVIVEFVAEGGLLSQRLEIPEDMIKYHMIN